MTNLLPLLKTIRTLSRPLDPMDTEMPARIVSMPGLKAVVFDVYGTLFVSGSGDVGTAKASFQQDAVQEAFKACKIPLHKSDLAGHTIDLFFESIAREHEAARTRGIDYPEIVVEEIWGQVMDRLLSDKAIQLPETGISISEIAIEFECRVNPVWPMPGAQALLEKLDANYTLGIVSNAQFFTPLLFEALMDSAVEDCGFKPDLSVWSYAHRIGKPSQRLFQILLEQLDQEYDVTPSGAVYVGNDLRNDIWPAQALGMKTVLFAGDQRSLRLREEDPDCRGVVPDAVITELGQLESILGL